MASRLEKHRSAIKTVEKVAQERKHTLVIHYSCESFYDRPEGRSARITSIAVRNLESAVTHSFSIHKAAEVDKKTTTVADTDYDRLEKKMLKDFYDFVESHQNYIWLHWNMRDINYGFPALEHRYEVLGGKPKQIPEERLFDLARILVSWYGTGYAGHPRLTSLMKKNRITDRDFLSGAEEAGAFDKGEYVKLHQSTLRKVDVMANIFGRLEDGTLKTNSSWRDIYGGFLPMSLNFVLNHWLVAGIGLVSSVVGLVGGIWSFVNWLGTSNGGNGGA
ncbi:MAG: hypothetical protein R3E76_02670 [Planctomycetota bacterium]